MNAMIMKQERQFSMVGPDTGEWLTFSHPLGSDMSIWHAQVEALSADYRVLVYNTRGHGPDAKVAPSCDMDDLADDVLRLWAQLGIQRSHFVGLSLGGCVGVALASREPDRVLSLVVANARLGMDAAASAMWRQRASTALDAGMSAITESTLSRWLTPAFMQAEPGIVNKVRHTLLHTLPQGFSTCALALSSTHLQERLPALSVRTLFISGIDDQAVPVHLTQAYAHQNPGFDYAALAGPHLLNIENPDGFNTTVRRFLAGR